MKNLQRIIKEIKNIKPEWSGEFEQLLWAYICYSPKMPLRLPQEQLLKEAEKISLKVTDEYFTGKDLSFNVFRWGTGRRKLLLTHGWGSKATDFNELIVAIRSIGELEIISFDAPGNGSSEGELSNLILYVLAVKAIVLHYGKPDVVIGHSLGAMANIIALREMQITPMLLVSLTPLLKLKENFEASMDALNISKENQIAFLESFRIKFGLPASYFTFDDWYKFDVQMNHWLAFDSVDAISPYEYMKEFLDKHHFIKTHNYEGVGHGKAIKSPEIVNDLMEVLTSALSLAN